MRARALRAGHPGVWLCLGICLLLLGGCGFHLRTRVQSLHFGSLYLDGNANLPFTAELEKTLQSYPGLVLAKSPKDAEVRLQILDERRDRNILSLTTAGRVRELTLVQRVSFQVFTPDGETVLPPGTVVSDRILSVNDSDTLAQETEQAEVYRQLSEDAVRQLMMRLAAIKSVHHAGSADGH